MEGAVAESPWPVSQTAAAPIEAEMQPRARAEAEAERDRTVVAANRRFYPTVHDLRHVLRHIDDLRIRREDSNESFFGVDLLLRRVLQGAGGHGLGAKPLNRRYNVLLLIHESGAERVRPIEFFIHHPQEIRKSREGLNARVQPHLIQLGKVGRRAQESHCLNDIHGIGRRSEDLREQWVWIERHRPEQLIELLRREGDVRLPGVRRGGRVVGRRIRLERLHLLIFLCLHPCREGEEQGGCQEQSLG